MISGDRAALALGVAAVIGALHPSSATFNGGVLLAGAALAARSPAGLVVATALVVSGLAQRSLDGLDGAPVGAFRGDVVLIGDPEPSFGGVRVDVRADGRRLEARADGAAADALADRLAGEVVRVRGTQSVAPPDAAWLVPRHISGRLTILKVDAWRPGDAASRLANTLRRTLDDGATPLSERQRSLYAGLAIGDDRAQPADLADDFRGAGLTHLLAVSGQNVAFALAIVGPVLRRLRLWPRLLLTLAVIGLFGVMTRFEPSVLRASAMAALAAVVTTGGQPTTRVRVIALAVGGLLLVDPLLVRAVGFRLSVCAAFAIVVLAPRLVAMLPGPRWLREAMAVTVAAQLGVAPVLLTTFGPLPVASLPANLLAVPVAGTLMVWGLTAGLVAGLVGGPAATVLHLPTRVGLTWLEQVSHRAAHAPLGELRAVHLVAVAVGLALAGLSRHPGTLLRRVGLATAAGAVVLAVVAAHAPGPLRTSPAVGITVWREGPTAVVVLGGVGGRSPLGEQTVLAALREAGVGPIALLVLVDDSTDDAVVAGVVRAHATGGVVSRSAAQRAALGGLPVPVGRPPPDGVLVVGDLELRITSVPDRLVVDARPRHA